MRITVRPERITAAHLPSLAALEAACFKEPWSEKSLALLLSPDAFGYAVTKEGRALCYAGMLTVLDEGQVTNVATLPDYRHCGLAGTVLDALLAEAAGRGIRTVSLEVRVSNVHALSLYRSRGFREAGRRVRFYTHPTEDAWVMIRTLSNDQNQGGNEIPPETE